MPSITPLDICGRLRSPATLPEFHYGRPPRSKGLRYPADPPTVEEIIAVMHAAGDHPDAVRLRGLIVVLWRAGLRVSEALALTESDLDANRGAILVRHGTGDKRREVGMDCWGCASLTPGSSSGPRCRSVRCSACCAIQLAGGRGHLPGFVPSCTSSLAEPGSVAGSRRISCDMLTRWKCLVKECRCWLSNASSAMRTWRSRPVYLRGIDNTEIVDAVHERPAPMIPATHGL